MTNNFFCGIDIGSSATKVVIVNSKGVFLDGETVHEGVGSAGVDKAFHVLYKRNSLNEESCSRRIVTGYGRIRYKEADEQISELSCHAKGVFSMMPETRTIIDIGGQDLKVIRVTHNGIIEEFAMNDKCAAGTGRFLDVMSRVLGINMDAMGTVDLRADKEIQISNTCTVFAESEVISFLSEGERMENIVAGIHRSVAKKAATLARRVGVVDKVILTGGVAQNLGVVRAMTKELGREILVPEKPQLTGALGAALFARERYKNKK